MNGSQQQSVFRWFLAVVSPPYYLRAANRKLWAIFFFILSTTALSQSAIPNQGKPGIRNFFPEEYHSDITCTNILQGQYGFIYVANQQGVLEYDGAEWRLIDVPAGQNVRALVESQNGLIYTGGVKNLGFLAPDKKGQLAFHSLVQQLPEEQRDFGFFRDALAVRDTVYLRGEKLLVQIIGKEIVNTWPVNGWRGLFYLNGSLYVDQLQPGLCRLKEGKLELIRGGERFANTHVYLMLPLGEEVLLGTMDQGLFRFRPEQNSPDNFLPFSTEAEAYLLEHQCYTGMALPNGQIAIGTFTGGLVIIDEQGSWLDTYHRFAAHYPGIIPPRPYGQHEMVGANSFMLKLMKSNIDSLGLTADSANFDSVIARTNRMLQQQSAEVTLTRGIRTLDSVQFRVRIDNLAGHKFPTGYPSRRTFIELVVKDINQDTIFASGLMGSNYELIGQDVPYEPHYEKITTPDQVQIYELVMGDVNGDVTTTLRRAATPLKDNRILPRGFTMIHPSYDTVRVVGAATQDPAYSTPGGYSTTLYEFPINGYTDSLLVTARLWYQTVRPGWLDETFANNSADIDQFRDMYNASDKTPVLIGEDSEYEVLLSNDGPRPIEVKFWPNPTPDGNIFLEVGEPGLVEEIRIYDMAGKLIQQHSATGQSLYLLNIGEASGVYMIEVVGQQGKWASRVVKQ